MNELIKSMALDMDITPYQGETDSSYYYRVIYSALGRWCLETARGNGGISKHAQSIILNNLTEKFIAIFPEVDKMLLQEEQVPISVFIRRVYEETGYLITDQNNHNNLTHYQRGLKIGSQQLLFGVNENMRSEGLGIFSENSLYFTSWREFLIRDSLDYEEYLSSAFNLTLFSPRDIGKENLLYFNPKTNDAPSSSWINTMNTDKTIARNKSNGSYYRVMRYEDELLYYEEAPSVDADGLTGFEYRRLYNALKKHYGFPLKAQVRKLDAIYSKIILSGYLPNREYYLMLLCSWPCRMYCNKREFIIKKEYLSFVQEVFDNIGIEIIGG